METFESGIDERCRHPKSPTVARIRLNLGYGYCVIGTEYGYLRTAMGDVRTWRSYSGAHKAAKRYEALFKEYYL